MSSRSHKEVALRRARGHDSTSAFVHLEGQKRLSVSQQRRLDRVREGLCPECAKPVSEPVRLGQVVVHGKRVNKCDECRLQQALWAEERKKRAAQAAQNAPPQAEGDEAMATLLGERINQATEIDVAKERFNSTPDSKILVVGVRPNNLQREARAHARIIVWDPTDRFNGMPVMPTNVSVVMCTKVCSHQVSQGLRKSAGDRRAFMFSGLITSGDIRKHLAELLNLDRTKTHDGTTDDLGPVEMPPAAPPRLVPAPKLVAPPPPEEPMAQTEKRVFDNPDPSKVLDDAMDMLGQAIAAMQLAKEQLAAAKSSLVESAESMKKMNALREMLKSI